MRRTTSLAAGFMAASFLLLGCGSTDGGDTGTSDAEVDSQVEGNRDTVECDTSDDDAAITEDSATESGDEPQGSTESADQSCTSGANGDDTGGDGESNAGGAPGVGTPSDGGSGSSGGSDTGTDTGAGMGSGG